MFGAMFSGRHALPLDNKGYHFIDRGGTHFRLILNFLRTPETFAANLAEPQLQELKSECDYYGLFDLMFPVVSLSPFTITTTRNNTVTVSQDANAIFKVEDAPLRTCVHCPSVQYYLKGIEVCLKNFRATLEKKGGALSHNQPQIDGLCNCCYKYREAKVNRTVVVFNTK